MKVLYDHQIFTLQKFGGISRYFTELMNNSNSLFEYKLLAKFSDNEYLKGNILSLPNIKGKQKIQRIINYYYSVCGLKYSNYDIVHPTYYDPYVLSYSKKKIVLTVYDMIHEIFPQYFHDDKNILKNKAELILKADSIIAISESTKKDILNFFPNIEEKISVVHLGYSFSSSSEVTSDSKKYILFTGQRSYYKNFELFLRAAAPLLVNNNIELKCTGNPFSEKEVFLLDELKISNLVKSFYVNDDILSSLYSNAIAFVFPSLYEGFGIPVLEAFASNCPAILSNTSSLPEVGGDAAVYFDPYSIQDMRESIEKVILSEDLQKSLILKGRERLNSFSTKKCAEDTSQIYKKTINK